MSISRRHGDLLEARGLDIEMLERLGVSSSDELGNDTIAIPYFRGDQIVGVKFRTISGEKRFSQKLGSEQILYNRNCLTDETLEGQPVVICEGEIDCWAALQAGFARSVSVPAGAPNVEIGDRASAKYGFIADMPDLAPSTTFILAADGDDPGAALRADLALRLGAKRCRWVKYPVGCKDLGDALQRYAERGVVETLSRAQWIVGNVYRMSDIPPVAVAVPVDSGFPGLAEHYKLRLGDLTVVTGVPMSGKALSLDTDLATPSGWLAMGKIAIGDEVFDERGKVCRVTNATPVMIGRPCFRVGFSDGSFFTADSEHQWLTISERARRSVSATRAKRGDREQTLPKGTDQRHKRTYPGVVTTAEIAASLRGRGKWNHQIDNASALDLPHVELPIAPYTLGAWLGDGDSAAGRLTCFDDEIREAIGAEGYRVTGQATRGVYTIRSIQPLLRRLGVLDNKHIPPIYLRASREQRAALLRGLMDTDGSCAARGMAEFTSTRYELARGVYELVCSLGLRCSWGEYRAKRCGKDCGPNYRLHFTSPFPVFSIPRKVARQRSVQQHRSKASYRSIISCERIASVPVRCIEVDSQSSLYLAGRAMIPTHNSTFICDLACRMALRHGWPVCFASFEQEPTHDQRRELRKWYGGGLVGSLDAETLDKADRWIDEQFAFVVPDDESHATLPWVMERMAVAALRFGSRLFVLDPWNEVEHDRPEGMSLTEYTGQALREFRRFARRYEAHMIVAAHPAKMRRDTDGHYPIPSLYDISDCYSGDTEVLTERGWLPHSEVTIADRVANFDLPTSRLEWHCPVEILRYQHQGVMAHFYGPSMDMLVTPNHRMVLRPAWDSGAGQRWAKGEWQFCPANKIPGARFQLPLAAMPSGGDEPTEIGLDGGYPVVPFLRFLGWWLAEGWVASRSIAICQQPGAIQEAMVSTMVADLGLSISQATSGYPDRPHCNPTWRAYVRKRQSPGIVEWMIENCGGGAANKRIPEMIWSLSFRLKRVLVEAFIDGDGFRPNNRRGSSAVTTSPFLRDGLQRLAVECGIPCSVGPKRQGKDHHAPSWQINFGRDDRTVLTMQTDRHLSWVPYDGEVWCLRVPTGAYVTRRNGRVAFQGNSAHWYNRADVGIIVHRKTDDETLIRVAKSRYHDQIGRPGDISVRYVWQRATYEAIEMPTHGIYQ